MNILDEYEWKQAIYPNILLTSVERSMIYGKVWQVRKKF